MSNLHFSSFVTFAMRYTSYTLFPTLEELRLSRDTITIPILDHKELRGRDAAVRSTVKTIQ